MNHKYKFVHLELFDIKILFFEKHVFRKQKRTAAYGRTSLVSDFKLICEKDDVLSSRHKWIFEVPHSVHEYIKTRIPKKRYQTNTVRTFWDISNASALRYLGVDHFGLYCIKTEGKQGKLYIKIF